MQGQRNKLGDSIAELLHSHRLMHTLGDDDSGLPLVDALTPPGDTYITLGIEEIELMAGELAWLVIPADTSNNSAWCDDCHGYTHKAGNPCADAKALEGEALPKENAILCSADEVDRLRKIEEAAKQKIPGLVWAVAAKDKRTVSMMFDTDEQANAFVAGILER